MTPAEEYDEAWTPIDGDYAQRKDRNSNVHLVHRVEDDYEAGFRVTMACGQVWYSAVLRHASEADAYQRSCRKCWDTM